MKIYNVNSLQEMENLRPTIVLVMAKINPATNRSWCGDTNRAIKNINKMKNDPLFLWHKLAIVESSRNDWRSYLSNHPNSRATFAHSKYRVDRVPTLFKWKNPNIKLIEDEIYMGSEENEYEYDDESQEEQINYGYRNLKYMLLTGELPYNLPIYMDISYVFKPEDIEKTNPSVVYFKGIYNPGYGLSWSSSANKNMKQINKIVSDSNISENQRLTICNIFRSDWYKRDNELRNGDLGYRLYSASSLIRWNDKGYQLIDEEIDTWSSVEDLFNDAEYKVEDTTTVMTTTTTTPTTTEVTTTTEKATTTTLAPTTTEATSTTKELVIPQIITMMNNNDDQEHTNSDYDEEYDQEYACDPDYPDDCFDFESYDQK